MKIPVFLLLTISYFSIIYPLQALEPLDDAGKTSFTPTEKNALIDFYNGMSLERWLDDPKEITPDPCTWRGIQCIDDNNFSIDIYSTGLGGAIPESFGALKKLKKLSLGFNAYLILPHNLDQLENLESLKITEIITRANDIFNIKNKFDIKEITKLSNLKHLDLSVINIFNLPEDIDKLTNLETLILTKNNLTSLPKKFVNLTKLTTLKINEPNITSLPENIENLINLTELSITSHSETMLFKDFLKLKSLKKLSINSNKLRVLPDEFSNLINLQELTLNIDKIFTLPESLGQAFNLKKLFINSTYLKELPRSFKNITQLEVLSIRANSLTKISNIFTKLDQLEFLTLDTSNLTSLPNNFEGYPNLKSLFIKAEDLILLPEKFGYFPNLKSLAIINTPLKELPANFGDFTQLESLTLTNSYLEYLPEKMGHLPHLKYLIMTGNPLIKLPSGFGKTPELKSVNLSNNKLTSLPEGFGGDITLFYLFLSGNELTTLPESLGYVNSIFGVYLNHNKLTSLPESIGNLRTSFGLFLHNNQLTSLPESFGNLTTTQGIFLSHNQLTSLPKNFGNISINQFDNDYYDTTNNNNPIKDPQAVKIETEYHEFILQYEPFRGNSIIENNPLFSDIYLLAYTGSIPPINDDVFDGNYRYNGDGVLILLDHNQLTSLPDSFINLPNISGLSLKNNQLTVLPNNFGSLDIKGELNLSFNQLTSLPETFGDLSEISLFLQNNQLTTLPNHFISLKLREALNLSHNQLTKLPDNFLSNESSLYLSLDHNKLVSLPKNFENSAIYGLTLDHNKLTHLPPDFSQLFEKTSIRELSLKNNELTSIPNFNHLELTSLDLSNNKLTKLPEHFAPPSLDELFLAHNQLTKINQELDNLTSLNVLDLSFNQLTSINNIALLSSLNTLKLGHNQLTQFPNNLTDLIYLRSLNIDGNQLTSLPKEIEDFNDLSFLSCENNQLTTFSSDLPKLTYLSLAHNKITKLSIEPTHFLELETLNIANNQLSELPNNFETLSLVNLDISFNQFDNDIFSVLPPLQILELWNNPLINEIPTEFADLISPDELQTDSPKISQVADKTKPLVLIIATHNELKPALSTTASQMGNMAYRALSARGVPAENILYLNNDLQQAQDIQVYARPSLVLIKTIINQWFPENLGDNQEIIFYMVGDGFKGRFIYQVDKDEKTYFLDSHKLKNWFDWKTKETSIHLIYDAPYAQNYYSYDQYFIINRYVSEWSNSYNDEKSYFRENNLFSFSFLFWTNIYNHSFSDSLILANKIGLKLRGFYGETDTNYYSENPNNLPISTTIKVPTITDLAVQKRVINQDNFNITLKVDTARNKLDRVWVTLIPPNIEDATMKHLNFEMTYNNETQSYQVNIQGLQQNGDYQIAAYTQTKEALISLPVVRSIFIYSDKLPQPVIKRGKETIVTFPNIAFNGKNYQASFRFFVIPEDKYPIKITLLDKKEISNQTKTVGATINTETFFFNIPNIKIEDQNYNIRFFINYDYSTPTWESSLWYLGRN